MATKKTTKKTAARKTPATATTEQQDAPKPEDHRSCAYPSCSHREETQAAGIPACNLHAPLIEAQKNDGAGIQQLVESYKGP